MSRIFAEPFDLYPATSISATTNTDAFECSAFGPIAIMLIATSSSSLNATATVEVSPDKSNWGTVSDSSQAFTGDLTHVYNFWFGAGGNKYMRIKFTRTAGSCTLRVILSGMRFG